MEFFLGTLTLSMIVKNEEKYLDACLESVREVADEIVVVDTGSTDKTKDIAKRHNAKIYDFEWIRDFSAARNFALKHSSGDWILYMDADERLDPHSIGEVKQVKNLENHAGIAVTVTSSDDTGGKPNTMKYFRLFRNNPELCFRNRVHEQIYESMKALNYEFIDSSILIHHLGYDISKDELQKKAKRNLQLLFEELEHNETSYILYHIAQTYNILEEKAKAREYFFKSLEKDDLQNSSKALAYRFIAAGSLEQGDMEKARKYVDQSLSLNSVQPLANMLAGKIYALSNQVEKAKKFFLTAAENNMKLLTGEITSEFDIMADQRALLFNCIDFAVQSKDKELFSHFYKMMESLPAKATAHSTSYNTSGIDELPLLKKLMENTPLTEQEITDLSKVINENNIDAYLRLISALSDVKQRLIILHSMSKSFINSISFLRAYGDALLQNTMYDESIGIYTHAIQQDANNPVLYFDLISALLQAEKIDAAFDITEQGKNYFRKFDHIVEKFSMVESKILSLKK